MWILTRRVWEWAERGEVQSSYEANPEFVFDPPLPSSRAALPDQTAEGSSLQEGCEGGSG